MVYRLRFVLNIDPQLSSLQWRLPIVIFIQNKILLDDKQHSNKSFLLSSTFTHSSH